MGHRFVKFWFRQRTGNIVKENHQVVAVAARELDHVKQFAQKLTFPLRTKVTWNWLKIQIPKLCMWRRKILNIFQLRKWCWNTVNMYWSKNRCASMQNSRKYWLRWPKKKGIISNGGDLVAMLSQLSIHSTTNSEWKIWRHQIGDGEFWFSNGWDWSTHVFELNFFVCLYWRLTQSTWSIHSIFLNAEIWLLVAEVCLIWVCQWIFKQSPNTIIMQSWCRITGWI